MTNDTDTHDIEWYEPRPNWDPKAAYEEILNNRKQRLLSKVAEQNHKAALNGLGYKVLTVDAASENFDTDGWYMFPEGNKGMRIDGIRIKFPPDLSGNAYKPRRRTRGIWLPITLILLCLAVGTGVWLTCAAHSGRFDTPETANIISSPISPSEEAPDTPNSIPSPAFDSTGNSPTLQTNDPAGASSPDPYMLNLRVTWYDLPEGNPVSRDGDSVRSWVDRATELGLDGICACGKINGTTWWDDVWFADPPVVLQISELGRYLLVDHLGDPNTRQIVDVWVEDEPIEWVDRQNVWEVDYPASTVGSEVE